MTVLPLPSGNLGSFTSPMWWEPGTLVNTQTLVWQEQSLSPRSVLAGTQAPGLPTPPWERLRPVHLHARNIWNRGYPTFPTWILVISVSSLLKSIAFATSSAILWYCLFDIPRNNYLLACDYGQVCNIFVETVTCCSIVWPVLWLTGS